MYKLYVTTEKSLLCHASNLNLNWEVIGGVGAATGAATGGVNWNSSLDWLGKARGAAFIIDSREMGSDACCLLPLISKLVSS